MPDQSPVGVPLASLAASFCPKATCTSALSLTTPWYRRMTSEQVLETLAGLFVYRGVPEHIRSDNGPEFTAQAVRDWLGRVGVKRLFIEPGSPWENGYNESFNGKLRDQPLDGEIFYTLREAKVLRERWRWHYNHVRPHSSLGYRPPAPAAMLPGGPGSGSLRLDLQAAQSNALAGALGLT